MNGKSVYRIVSTDSSTWILLPVSGVVPSMVRMISNFSVTRSVGETDQRGEASSILCERTMGQNSWKKS